MRKAPLILSLAAVFVWTAIAANAQSASSGTIRGRVTDAQGAVVPNATVTATNKATGGGRSVTTTGSGVYNIPNLQPGTYDVSAQSTNFKAATVNNVVVDVGSQRDVNFTMNVAGATTVVEVTGQSPLIETAKTDVSSVLNNTDIQRLPAFAGAGGGANDYVGLAAAAPGVRFDTSTLTPGEPIAPGSFNNRANLYNVDGANMVDQVDSGRDGLGASVDEVQEFQVLTNNYNAEYGQAGGLILNVITKSGTNGLHGEGHMFFRGRNLTASQFFYNQGLFAQGSTAPCPASNFDAAGNLTTVAGCARAPFHRTEGGFTLGGPIIKDRTFWFVSYEQARQAFPFIITPPSGAVTVQQPVKDLLWSVKLDHKITTNNQLTVRYNTERNIKDNDTAQIGNNITPDSLLADEFHSAALNIGVTSTITPTLVNEARAVGLRFITNTVDKSVLPGQQHAAFYTGANFLGPQGGWNHRYQAIDNLSWTHGSHTVKTGFNISYYPWYSLFTQFHFGQWGDYDATDTIPGSFTIGLGPAQVRSKDNIYGVYLQDTWRLTSNLTMNYGLRYDFEAGAFKGGTIPTPGGGCLQANGIVPACSSDKNNFQPRVGFTYSPGFWPGLFGGPGRTLIKASFAEVTMLAFNNVVLDSRNFDGLNLFTAFFDPTCANWPALLAAYPNRPSDAVLAVCNPNPVPGVGPNFGRIRPISPDLHNPEFRMVNFGVERQIGKDFMVQAQYIGQFGFGLFGERDTNYRAIVADPAHPGFFYYGAKPNPLLGNVRTNENSRTSHYNGLVVSATKRMSQHIQFNASYTWSHSLTSGEDFFGLSEPGDPRNIRADLGPSFNDIRHLVNYSVVLDTGRPLHSAWLGWATNDLTFSFLGQHQSGRPYPLSTGTGPYSGGRWFGAGNETAQRPNVGPDGTVNVNGIASFTGETLMVGPNGAAICGCPQNTFLAPAAASTAGPIDTFSGDVVDFQQVNGNITRNMGLSPAWHRVDFSLTKTIHFIPGHEGIRAELRADVFNIFNHANFEGNNANPNTSALAVGTVGCVGCISPTTGQIIGANGKALTLSDVRLSHAAAIADMLNPNFGGLGDPSFTDIPRTIQLSFHIRF
ncbi:MAG: TonB-dependent receptor domain-containing protein [Terriglobales bacterium]